MYNYRSTPATPRCSLTSPTRWGGCLTTKIPSYDRMRPTSVTAHHPTAPVETIFTLLNRSPYASSSRSLSNRVVPQHTTTPSLQSSPSRKKPSSCQHQAYRQHQHLDQHRIKSGTRPVNKQCVQSARTTETNVKFPKRSPTKQLTSINARQNCNSGQQAAAAAQSNGLTKTLCNSPWHISSNLASLAEFSDSIFSDEGTPAYNCRVSGNSQKTPVMVQPQISSGLDEIEELEGSALLKRCHHSKDTDATVQSSHTSQTGSNNHTDESIIPALPPGSMQSTELMQYILGVLMTEKSSRPTRPAWNSGVYTLYKRGKD
ncbi:Hypothetical protein GLP15_476 [Giardia lamblia P15]|uniref:Uncharacterized protein n=1 Tax=Giardia intestinalis (strain P15) TaxID=658858 RepID=E1F6H2_GIAIA|nr:Hypothetical protein GLP15_476 [Giardia lamblia P15]